MGSTLPGVLELVIVAKSVCFISCGTQDRFGDRGSGGVVLELRERLDTLRFGALLEHLVYNPEL